MASIYEQFQQPSQDFKFSTISGDMASSGYIDMTTEPELPIFNKSKKNFTPSDKITHVAVSNKYLVVAMSNNRLFRIDYQENNITDEISMSKQIKLDKVTNLFLDPSGKHLLVNVSSATVSQNAIRELYYLAKGSTKLKLLTTKNHEITEVGWNYGFNSDSTTGPILLGSSKGIIFESEITSSDYPYALGLSQFPIYFKVLFELQKTTPTKPITGLEFFNIPDEKRCIIFVATLSHFYYFSGPIKINSDEKPVMYQIFLRYLNVQEPSIELCSNNTRARFKFWSTFGLPKSFAMVTDREIIYSEFNHKACKDIESFKERLTKIPYPPRLNVNSAVLQKPPHSVVVTEFHVIIAYNDQIKAISLLNNALVYEENFNDEGGMSNEQGKVVTLVKDPKTEQVWLFTESFIYKINIHKEDRHVWRIFCDKGRFELALRYAVGHAPHHNLVLMRQAQSLFAQKKYQESAEIYAKTQCGFEEICLKYIEVGCQDALTTFLYRKLDHLGDQDKTQTTMIVIWVVELYLDQLESMRLQGKELTNAYDEVRKAFNLFLASQKVSTCIRENKSTIYKLLDSHGDKEYSARLAQLNEDHEILIRQHIYKNNFLEALDILSKQDNKQLFYQFVPTLIQELPAPLITTLMQQSRHLSPLKLLPGLMSHRGEIQARQVIKYLEHCVDKLRTKEKSIHNYLLSLYVKYDETKLMRYLDVQGADILEVNYDVLYALRFCQENNMKRACVHLFCLLGVWESSIDLALTIDVKLAKEIANQVDENDTELQKKLWLKIAKHVVTGENDIKKAMEFLKNCDLIRIEDILPFCSDFDTIDHFKSAICNSLKDYNHHIQDLKDEMEEATKSSEQVREAIQTFRNRHTTIKSDDVCNICEKTLLIRPFYIFPCLHRFHMDCLLAELIPTLGPRKQAKLDELHKQLNAVPSNLQDNVSTASGVSVKDIQGEIDNIVASECLYCGESMIRNIDTLFIDEKEYDRVLKEWE